MFTLQRRSALLLTGDYLSGEKLNESRDQSFRRQTDWRHINDDRRRKIERENKEADRAVFWIWFWAVLGFAATA